MIAIEKNVPVPTESAKAKYPFRTMVVGDSFFVESDTKGRTVTKLLSATRNYPDRKFTARQVEGGVRVWRTA
jgi:hypothetical protein